MRFSRRVCPSRTCASVCALLGYVPEHRCSHHHQHASMHLPSLSRRFTPSPGRSRSLGPLLVGVETIGGRCVELEVVKICRQSCGGL